ncbi:hypothetical protein JYU34_011160 [Plutella xylostella]|uniref:Secreted protein n=1 Tax=Plutella xylostella TaxID=51655 RepID=A0ABQ7QG93_PLUXY|nr:hypothetical protein JYU34_011160 [Plutella xylostella]
MECYARLLKTTLIFGTGLYSGLLLAQDGGVGRVDPPGVIIEKTSGTIKNLLPERPPPCPPKNKEDSNLKKKKDGGGKGDNSGSNIYVDEDSSETKYRQRGSKTLEDEREVKNGKEPKTDYSEPKPIIEEKPTFKECKCSEQKQGDQEAAAAAAAARAENQSKKPCKPKKKNEPE